MPIEPGMVEWKLYVRLFDEIDREFEGKVDGGAASGLPFLRIDSIDGGKILVLQADPTQSAPLASGRAPRDACGACRSRR